MLFALSLNGVNSAYVFNNQVEHISNIAPSGGPLISLETTEKADSLSIVWMAIGDDQLNVDGYFVYVNGQLCGNKVLQSLVYCSISMQL